MVVSRESADIARDSLDSNVSLAMLFRWFEAHLITEEELQDLARQALAGASSVAAPG